MVRIFFKDVLKTTVTRTGTKIEYAVPRKDNCLMSFSCGIKPEVFFDNAKLLLLPKTVR